MGARHGRTIASKTCGNCSDPAAYRRLGDVRRKHGAGRRRMAYSRSGSILPCNGNNLDHPIETLDPMDSDRLLQGAVVKTLKLVY